MDSYMRELLTRSRRPRERRSSSSRRIRRITVKVTRISLRNVTRKTVERQIR